MGVAERRRRAGEERRAPGPGGHPVLPRLQVLAAGVSEQNVRTNGHSDYHLTQVTNPGIKRSLPPFQESNFAVF
jgi:hypothetical protein